MAIYKLGDISIIQNGSTPSTKNESLWKKEIPFLGPSDIEANRASRYVTKNKAKRPGTILISTTATIGNIGILEVESWFNQQITSIEANPNFVKDKFLFYYFLTQKNKIKKISDGGSVFSIIHVNTFRNWIIDLSSLEEQQKIIDIIEPIEKMKNKFMTLNKTVLELIKKIELSDEKIRIIDFFYEVREKPKNIKQISAKVLSENKGLILKAESPNTYKTNTFYCNEGTFIFCSIRTYLQKWGITPFDADVNGTLFQFEIKKNLTPLINYLKNESSWSTFNLLSKGTKMPVLSKKDFLNIEINKTKFEIKKIDLILKNINKIIIDMESLIEKSVSLLVK
ncbi:hypothetical protein CXP39_01320 [Mesoplasma syrphidae]|uniref:Type I restriction modification DNA specificity domain-containing protein n=1 Tax=Mesoplasma syrphidae TaxID=225999 RepID=A0A2K9BR12_9MOLU|nr:restriction endonuclease subunit S [Mesoplasma syrphidae]AUF83442.1 hypothetical protein CXP39_01320 [Mesoplasma syrphidae]